jgi:hypothetical protein
MQNLRNKTSSGPGQRKAGEARGRFLGFFPRCLDRKKYRNRPRHFDRNTTSPMKTFRELYCAQHSLPLDRFEKELISRSLHLHARPIYWLLGLNRHYTSPDYEFVRGVGELRNRREFRNEAAEYHYHPHNRGLLRSALKLRVSSQRLQRIFEREIEEHGSRPPM